MIDNSYEVYKVVDPSKRDAEWMNGCITTLRRRWQPIVNQVQNRINKDILFSTYDMAATEAMFKEKGDFLKTKPIIPLPLLENIKNSLVEEILKNPPKMELKANDATALTDKQYDMILLRHKSQQEAIVNQINKSVGYPPEVIGDSKFKTNINEFYRMGLDPDDPEDIQFYEQNDFPKLKYEIAGQKLIDIILKLNRFDEDTVEEFVIDILANKVICMDIYVDQITGEIKYKYIYPETFYGVFGKKNDGRDDICKGYEESVTVNEFLEKVGNDFDWERDWSWMLWAINYRNGWTYTGFRRNGIEYNVYDYPEMSKQMGLNSGVNQPNICNWNQAYTFEVYLGKIEFKVPNVTAAYLKNHKGEVVGEVDYNYQLSDIEQTEKYQVESWYQQKVYQSYYLSTSSISQRIYNWGEYTYAELYGANDEYAAGGMWYYRNRGKSAAELAVPYIKLCNDAFYKMLWAVYEAHPDWEVYQVEELTELAKVMFKEVSKVSQNSAKNLTQMQTQLTDIIKYFRNNLVKLKTIPRVDGKPVVQMNNLPVVEKRGLDPIAIAMQSVCMWAENQLKQKLGFNDLRWDGNIDNPRKGLGQGEMEQQQSMNNTGYIFRTIQFLKQHVCSSTLIRAQDIVKFKGSIPYKWISNLLGVENFENLKLLNEFASHRYALTFENYNAQMERQMFVQLVVRGLDSSDGRGGLSAMEAGLLLANEDWKSGLKQLTYIKYKKEKLARKQALQDAQIAQQNIMQQKEADMQYKNMEIQGLLQGKKIDADAIKYSADQSKSGKVETKIIGNQNDVPKEQAKAAADAQLMEKEAELKSQEPLPT